VDSNYYIGALTLDGARQMCTSDPKLAHDVYSGQLAKLTTMRSMQTA